MRFTHRRMAAALNRKLARRAATRDHFEKILIKACDYVGQDSVQEVRLLSFEATLKESRENLERLDDEICNVLEPEKVAEDVTESLNFLYPLNEVLSNISLKLRSLKLSNAQRTDSNLNASFSSAASSGGNLKCKLPRFEIPVFDGDPLEWQGVWNQFNVSFHSNDRISDVDKFSYLKSLLSGKALAVVNCFVC